METSIALRIIRLRRNIVSGCTPHLQARKLTQGLLYCLLYVGRNPGCSASELGQTLEMDPGYSTHTLHKLEELGYLERRPNPQDRRAMCLYLTEAGQRCFEDSHAMLHAWTAQAAAGLTKREQEQLTTLLSKVRPVEALEFPAPEQ